MLESLQSCLRGRAKLHCANCCVAGSIYRRYCHEATLPWAVADNTKAQRSGRLTLDLQHMNS